MQASLLLLVLNLGAAPQSSPASAPADIDRIIEESETFRPSFLKAGVTLRWGLTMEAYDVQSTKWSFDLNQEWTSRLGTLGYPLDLYRRLYVRDGEHGEWRLVSWPSDLTGLVEIRQPNDALEFVRLFSSVQTWYRFPQYGHLEVKPVNTVGFNLTGPAQMDEAEFTRLKLPETLVLRTPEGFRIRRSVIRMTCGEPQPGRRNKTWGFSVVDETVTTEGRYVLRVLLSEHAPSAEEFVQRLPPLE